MTPAPPPTPTAADLLAAVGEEVLESGDEERIAEFEEQLDTLTCRESLAHFVRAAWHVLENDTPLQWNWHHQLMCDVSQGMLEDWQLAKADPTYQNKVVNAAINVPPGSLKPVDATLLVQDKRRGLIPLSEIVVGDEVVTHLGRYRRVMQVAEHLDLPTLTLVTKRGRRIRAEGSHPFLTARGWVRADEVTTNDVLVAVHTTEDCGTRTIPIEEARLIGYLIGDGGMSKQVASATFTNQDPDSLADFIICAEKVGLRTHHHQWPPSQVGKMKAQRIDLGNKERKSHDLQKWLDKHDLRGKNSFTKRVPRAVMTGDREVIIEYLAAYWSCDGGIHDRRDLPRSGRVDQTTQSVRVDATTVSEGLARDHHALLQRLGLEFTLRRKVTKITKAMCGKSGERIGQDYVSWQLTAVDQDTAAKFMLIFRPRMRHEKRHRALGLFRTDVDHLHYADRVTAIEQSERVDCRCLQVDEDQSFVAGGVAVHNSRILSVFMPVWMWLRCPGWKVICLSVNDKASLRDGRASRQLLRSAWFQAKFAPTWSIREDQDSVSSYGNTVGGERLSQAMGSEIVGLRADCLLVDDANNPNEANIKTERDKINELWETNTFNRVNDLRISLRIEVQQRVHSEDFTGYLLRTAGAWSPTNRGGWLLVALPAEFEVARRCVTPWGSDPRTKEGESIDLTRFTPEVLAAERKRFQEKYAGQMQQRPTAAGGGSLKKIWFNWFRLARGVMPEHDEEGQGHDRPAGCKDREKHKPRIVAAAHHREGWEFDTVDISVDAASKKTERGSMYGIVVAGGIGPRKFVLECASRRGEFHEIVDLICSLIVRWRPNRILIEDKAAGPVLITTLENAINSGQVVDEHDRPIMCVVERIPANGAFEERVDAFAVAVKQGLLFLLDGAEWVKEYVDEVSGYPAHATDDSLDATAQLVAHESVADVVLPEW